MFSIVLRQPQPFYQTFVAKQISCRNKFRNLFPVFLFLALKARIFASEFRHKVSKLVVFSFLLF